VAVITQEAVRQQVIQHNTYYGSSIRIRQSVTNFTACKEMKREDGTKKFPNMQTHDIGERREREQRRGKSK
jgi:hypothetical protein